MKQGDQRLIRKAFKNAASFMAYTKGLTPHEVVRVMNGIATRIDWSGCSRGHMSQAIALEEYGITLDTFLVHLQAWKKVSK